jgi:hypothetical protein
VSDNANQVLSLVRIAEQLAARGNAGRLARDVRTMPADDYAACSTEKELNV